MPKTSKWTHDLGKYPARYVPTPKERKEYLDTLRSIPCADCNTLYPAVCMDFDHLPNHQKFFTIMSHYSGAKWSKVLQEVRKCEVVCANCHRIRTLSRVKV